MFNWSRICNWFSSRNHSRVSGRCNTRTCNSCSGNTKSNTKQVCNTLCAVLENLWLQMMPFKIWLEVGFVKRTRNTLDLDFFSAYKGLEHFNVKILVSFISYGDCLFRNVVKVYTVVSSTFRSFFMERKSDWSVLFSWICNVVSSISSDPGSLKFSLSSWKDGNLLKQTMNTMILIEFYQL